MAKKKSRHYQIDSGAKGSPNPVFAPKSHHDDRASVDLRYFQKSFECFSSWQKSELKAFSNFIEKMASKSEAQVTSVTKTCHAHKGVMRKLPKDISPDVRMYSLDVTPKGRVHGFFMSGKFFLVWLDRDGSVLGH